MPTGQMQPHTGAPFVHPCTALAETEAQGVELHEGVAVRAEPAPQGVEPPVRRGMEQQMEQQAELVSPETAVA
jgi:hypothetical protein